MTTAAPPVDEIDDAEYELAIREVRRRKAAQHPAFLGHFTRCVDAKTGEEFDFDLLSDEEAAEVDSVPKQTGWFWHRELLDDWLSNTLNLELKARQIGITWLAALLALWTILFRPGTRVLILSVNQEEAIKVIARVWGMYKSLPLYLRSHVEISKPARGGDPSQEIEFRHPDGRKSSVMALPATEKAGHGETAALVILDEFSRQDFARSIWKGVFPVIDGGGRIIVISTANGVSNELTGEGNFFHFLWVNALTMNIRARFLGWYRHPRRDRRWYDTVASALPPIDRAEQYPENEEDAFINTGQCWFDLQKLNAYQARWRETGMKALYRMRWVEDIVGIQGARKVKTDAGEWRVYVEPVVGHQYAIGADVATGKGQDFSSAHCIDLSTAEIVAEYHAKVSEDVYAKDLHYTGRWFFNAIIAVENQGGHGSVVIKELRDGTKGRKAYTKLYRHGTHGDASIKVRERADFGFPMNVQTRPQVINQIQQWVQSLELPWITPETDRELRTFSVAKTDPSPRAQDGTNDDRVLSFGITLELYRQFGRHALKVRRPASKSRWRKSQRPWEV